MGNCSHWAFHRELLGVCVWGTNMNIHCKYDELVPVDSLRPYEKNRNKHTPEQIERLAKLLEYQGVRAPIVVVKTDDGNPYYRTIAKGHGTLDAIKLNGWKEAPVVFQEFDSEEQLYAYVQSDNAIQQTWSELDLSGINADLPELGPDFDIDLLGIKDFVLEPAEFAPGTIEEQGKLDRTQILECPRCQEHFERSEAKIIA